MKSDKEIVDFLEDISFFRCSIIGSDEAVMEFCVGKKASYGGSFRECVSKFMDGDINDSIDTLIEK